MAIENIDCRRIDLEYLDIWQSIERNNEYQKYFCPISSLVGCGQFIVAVNEVRTES